MAKLLKNMLVWDSNHEKAIYRDVTVDNGRILALHPVGTGQGELVYDGRGRCALLPGLVNAHTHAAMSLVRGLGEELPLMDWLRQKIWPAEEKLGAEHVLWGTRLALLEMLSSGVTSFADMYFFMDEVANATLESGMRATLCRGIVGVGDDGFDEKLKDGLALVDRFHGAKGRVRVQLGPHAPYTVPLPLMERIVQAASDKKVGIHLHWLETQDEVAFFADDLKMSPVDYLHKTGLLEAKELLLAHCVWHPVDGLDVLAARNVTVAHNPKSNLKLGSGFAPIKEMLNAGVRVALGTDGAASNNRLDVWDEMRTCALMHKGYHQDPTLASARQVLKMATVDGAVGMGYEHVGLIEPGYWADLMVVDLDQPQYVGCTEENLPEMLVYSGSSRDVRLTRVAGEVLDKDGESVTLDRAAVLHENNRLRKEIVSAL